MIWDEDENQDDLLSNDSLEHEGKGSDDKETVDNVRQLLIRLPKHRGNRMTRMSVLSKRAQT